LHARNERMLTGRAVTADHPAKHIVASGRIGTLMNVDERIAELTQRMLRRKFYAVLSQPSATPEKLKALLPASPTRRSIAPTALCAPVILPDLRAFRGVRQVRSDREVLQLRLEGFFYLLGIRPLLGCSAYRTPWITPAPRNLQVAAKVVRDRPLRRMWVNTRMVDLRLRNLPAKNAG
jgi:hypothetical protein